GCRILCRLLRLLDDIVGKPRPGIRQAARHAPLEFGGSLGMAGGIRVEALLPVLFLLRAGRALVPAGIQRVGNGEAGAVGPAQLGPGRGNLLVAQRRTMDAGAVPLVRRAPADDGLATDQRRARGFLARVADGGLDFTAVMAVDVADHLPTVGFEALRRVIGEPALGAAIDGNAVVV